MNYTIDELIKIIEEVGNRLDESHNKVIDDQIQRRKAIHYFRPTNSAIKFQKDHGHVLTLGQLYHLASMVANGKYPDGTYSDDECNAWELLKNIHDTPESFK